MATGWREKAQSVSKRCFTKNEGGPTACETLNYKIIFASNSLVKKHCALRSWQPKALSPKTKYLKVPSEEPGRDSLCSSSYHMARSPQRLPWQLHPAESAQSGHCPCISVLRVTVPWESTFACSAVGNAAEERSSQISADGITGSHAHELPCLHSPL